MITDIPGALPLVDGGCVCVCVRQISEWENQESQQVTEAKGPRSPSVTQPDPKRNWLDALFLRRNLAANVFGKTSKTRTQTHIF